MNSEELSERLWKFAARVGKAVDALPDTRLGRHVAGQLVRCGTAAGPNYDEGCAAESRGWLRFIVIAELLPIKRINGLLDECEQLIKIVGKSIATAKGKPRRDSN